MHALCLMLYIGSFINPFTTAFHSKCGFLPLTPFISSLAFICNIYFSTDLSWQHLNVESHAHLQLLHSHTLSYPWKLKFSKLQSFLHAIYSLNALPHYCLPPVPAFFLKLLSPMSPGDSSLLKVIASFPFLTLPDFWAPFNP